MTLKSSPAAARGELNFHSPPHPRECRSVSKRGRYRINRYANGKGTDVTLRIPDLWRIDPARPQSALRRYGYWTLTQ